MATPTALRAIALIGLSCLLSTVAAGRLALRPLSPAELRRALADAGVDGPELTPLGRATPSAIAGLGGFALGVANGLGGALIFDLLTSNETAAYVSNLINSLNTNATDEAASEGTQQEVCFASRSLNGDQLLGRANDLYDDDDRDLYDYEDDDEEFYSGQGRQVDDVYSSDYEEPANAGGITCIVVNRGRAILRHRRSTDAESPKEQKESASQAELSQKKSDQEEAKDSANLAEFSQKKSDQEEASQAEASHKEGDEKEANQNESVQAESSQTESNPAESEQKESSLDESEQQTESDQAQPTPRELEQAEAGQTESSDQGPAQKETSQTESDQPESSQTESSQAEGDQTS